MYDSYGRAPTVLGLLVFTTAFFLYSAIFYTTGENTWLGFMIIVTTIWFVGIWYSGIPQWETILIFIGIIPATKLWTVVLLSTLGDLRSENLDVTLNYFPKHFSIDAGLYILLAVITLWLGWLFSMVILFDFWLAAWAADTCVPVIRQWRASKQFEAARLKDMNLFGGSGMFCVFGILFYCLGWAATLLTLVQAILVAAVVKESARFLRWEKFVLVLLGWVLLIEVAVLSGWLKGLIFSSIVGTVLYDRTRQEIKKAHIK